MISYTTKKLVDHTKSELSALSNRVYSYGAMSQEIDLQSRFPTHERRKGTIHYFKDNGKDIGWIFHRVYDKESYDMFFWVDSEYRFRGIGHMMFLSVKNYFSTNNIRNIKLYAHSNYAESFFIKLKIKHPEINFDIIVDRMLIRSCIDLPHEVMV